MWKFLATSAVALGMMTMTASAEELHLYNWGDYINPEILTKFTEKTGIKVTLDTYASNEEMLAKIQAGATGYDIVFPSVHMVDIMLKLELLEKTDINKAKDWGNIDPDFLRAKLDPDGSYCMPYAWGTVGIFYNKKLTGKDISSWKEFFDVAKSGKPVTMLDDMREVLAVGLMANGYSVNTTDPAELKTATDWLVERKGDVSAFTYAVPGMILGGDVAASQFFVGLNSATTNDENLNYVIPSEGATMYEEEMCVLKTAPNKEAARKFMEFLLIPEISVMNTNQQFNGSVNIPARALEAPAVKDDPNINVDAETMKRLQMIQDVGPALKAYDRAWNTIRTSD